MNSPNAAPRPGLLSYDDALARILAAVPGSLPAENVTLNDARGRALAEAVIAADSLPPFDNSAVDGYALGASDWQRLSGGAAELAVGPEVRAGMPPGGPIPDGVAVPIYTGAPTPPGTASIVMVEDSERLAGGEGVRLHDAGSPSHIRRAGSDIARGAVAAVAGTPVTAGVVGLLAALNVGSVACARRPRVGIITTGDELLPVGGPPLAPGQIRNSNGPALRAAAEEAGAVVAAQAHAVDTPEDVQRALDACATCDLILTCGGVSVGAHDHVKAVVERVGALDFWRIAIKPGKPLAFGKVGGALFVGLPGNPVSALVTFELFVRPLLRKMAGFKDWTRPVVTATLDEPLAHEPGRREFVRARVRCDSGGEDFRATVTGAQGSHRLHSLVDANALLVAHESRADFKPGERLPAMLLTPP